MLLFNFCDYSFFTYYSGRVLCLKAILKKYTLFIEGLSFDYLHQTMIIDSELATLKLLNLAVLRWIDSLTHL